MNAKNTEPKQVIAPGRMKLWFSKYFPIPVVPVLSIAIAANIFPLIGKNQLPFAIGNKASKYGAWIPKVTPSGIAIVVAAPWLAIRKEMIKNPTA